MSKFYDSDSKYYCIQMNKESAYLDYYNNKNIIPVSQEINSYHHLKRSYLYATLGINLASLRSSRIIEFGPGGGYNAEATSSWGPSQYTLVDASNKSLEILNAKKQSGRFVEDQDSSSSVEIVESTILSFNSNQLYDLVIAEGLLGGQTHPEEILKHTSSFTDLGGVYITTTTSAASLLSETCRKIFLPHIKTIAGSFNEQIDYAQEIFAPHLDSLGTDLRPARDWVLDSILHEMSHENRNVFSMADVIQIIGEDFQFHGSSPRFLLDGRFYKNIGRDSFGINQIFFEQYESINVSFLDYRVPVARCIGLDASLCRDIEILCNDAWNIHLDICNNSDYKELDTFLSCMKNIDALLPSGFECTRLAINDFCENFPRFLETNDHSIFSSFVSWWGRGQQYISLMRNPQYE